MANRPAQALQPPPPPPPPIPVNDKLAFKKEKRQKRHVVTNFYCPNRR